MKYTRDDEEEPKENDLIDFSKDESEDDPITGCLVFISRVLFIFIIIGVIVNICLANKALASNKEKEPYGEVVTSEDIVDETLSIPSENGLIYHIDSKLSSPYEVVGNKVMFVCQNGSELMIENMKEISLNEKYDERVEYYSNLGLNKMDLSQVIVTPNYNYFKEVDISPGSNISTVYGEINKNGFMYYIELKLVANEYITYRFEEVLDSLSKTL